MMIRARSLLTGIVLAAAVVLGVAAESRAVPQGCLAEEASAGHPAERSDTGTGVPDADFYATPWIGMAPLTVHFTDTSTGPPVLWEWDFGDGGTSTEENPVHTYSTAASYTVSLRVLTWLGWYTETKEDYIQVLPPLTADFAATPMGGTAPLNVAFTDASTGGPTSWWWSFGDGGTDAAQNPSHSYAAAGSFTVSLTASNAYGSDTETKANYITVTPQTWFEDDDSAITYMGTWTTVNNAKVTDGHIRTSVQTGAQADFAFTGTGFRWHVAKGPQMGKARVTIDSRPPVLVDLYRATLKLPVVSKTGLAAGPHTLRIEVSGLKKASSTGYMVSVDTLDVVP